MSKRLVSAFAVVLLGAAELAAAPTRNAVESSFDSCNIGLPYMCWEDIMEVWEIEMVCNYHCPNWTYAACGTTSITCYDNPI